MIEHYVNLRKLASRDLSEAHLSHHLFTARLSLTVSGIQRDGTGAWSVKKNNDSVIFDGMVLNGVKYWISNVIDARYAVLQVKQSSGEFCVVLVDIDSSVKITQVNTIGMENTNTGNITFFNTPAIKLFDNKSPEFIKILFSHFVAFNSVLLGFIESYRKLVDGDLAEIDMKIRILETGWIESLDRSYDSVSLMEWKKLNDFYSLGKYVLLDVIRAVLETTNSSIYSVTHTNHQKHKDAMIYLSHMKNPHNSTIENLY